MKDNVLVTGGNGFLGRYIKSIYTRVTTLGRSDTNDLKCDLSREISLSGNFDVIVHAAGKAHSVGQTPKEVKDFYDVNAKGTANLLNAIKNQLILPKAFIFISSVAVYGVIKGNNIKEEYPLDAKDPYGLSKVQAERVIQEWCANNNVICGILRLPLVVGLTPPGNLGAMIKGIKGGYYFNISGGEAKKSMVLAEDVANIIPKLAEVGGIYNLTDGYHPSFYEVSHHISMELGRRDALSMPHFLAKTIATIGGWAVKFPLNSNKVAKMTSDLTFDDSKARGLLGWNPAKVLDKFTIQ